MNTFFRRSLGMGWLPDYPDFRDLTVEYEAVNEWVDTGNFKA